LFFTLLAIEVTAKTATAISTPESSAFGKILLWDSPVYNPVEQGSVVGMIVIAGKVDTRMYEWRG
jgi:hypothetical protein